MIQHNTQKVQLRTFFKSWPSAFAINASGKALDSVRQLFLAVGNDPIFLGTKYLVGMLRFWDAGVGVKVSIEKPLYTRAYGQGGL